MLPRIVTGMTLGSILTLGFIYPLLFSFLLLAILTHILIVEWKNLLNWRSYTFWLLMPIYPILPFVLLILLNHEPVYRHLILYQFVIVSGLDTGGYLIGSTIGTHKIAPRISPGKTWEGFFGGCSIALICFYLLMIQQESTAPWWVITLITLVICIFSLLGDLFESILKRRANVKDSGTILPGHGGFLDRFDGMLFVALFVFCFKKQLLVWLQ